MRQSPVGEPAATAAGNFATNAIFDGSVPSRRWLELGWRSLGLFNPNDSGVGALERRPRHDEGYHEGGGCGRRRFAFG